MLPHGRGIIAKRETHPDQVEFAGRQMEPDFPRDLRFEAIDDPFEVGHTGRILGHMQHPVGERHGSQRGVPVEKVDPVNPDTQALCIEQRILRHLGILDVNPFQYGTVEEGYIDMIDSDGRSAFFGQPPGQAIDGIVLNEADLQQKPGENGQCHNHDQHGREHRQTHFDYFFCDTDNHCGKRSGSGFPAIVSGTPATAQRTTNLALIRLPKEGFPTIFRPRVRHGETPLSPSLKLRHENRTAPHSLYHYRRPSPLPLTVPTLKRNLRTHPPSRITSHSSLTPRSYKFDHFPLRKKKRKPGDHLL